MHRVDTRGVGRISNEVRLRSSIEYLVCRDVDKPSKQMPGKQSQLLGNENIDTFARAGIGFAQGGNRHCRTIHNRIGELLQNETLKYGEIIEVYRLLLTQSSDWHGIRSYDADNFMLAPFCGLSEREP